MTQNTFETLLTHHIYSHTKMRNKETPATEKDFLQSGVIAVTLMLLVKRR